MRGRGVCFWLRVALCLVQDGREKARGQECPERAARLFFYYLHCNFSLHMQQPVHTFVIQGKMIMDDDPDDLAAAFFAQQAAKETQKTALPTKDWIRVINEATKNSSEKVDAEQWLVTTLPDAQTGKDGIQGIILNGESCKLLKSNDADNTDERHTEIRDQIKQLMLQKIKSDLQKNTTIDNR